ncbi:hypothetical protein N7474_003338 [Penicillium riverlandense]|uniref:uncharacterized protein n=1 Tax=Penicillium riverlandense TaxID=1903569 RepID=UPI002547E3A9|nr:uncharacterized protein N7474_003338 [Penicillium riverlandense]KAJ5826200.1 hypothetical protein N7474_003338 [Penicillium riverlandense]
MDEPASTSSAKRKRLSYACNYCREKKTRCDEEQPCRNCRVAGVECITTDKRRHGAPVEHRRRHDLPSAPQFGALAQSQSWNHVTTRSAPQRGQRTLRTPESHSSSIPPPSGQDRPRLWSQCWGPEGWKTGRLPMMPRFVGSSTLEFMTEWLDMAFYRLKGPKTHALAPVANRNFATFISAQAPELPTSETRQACLDNYWNTLHQIFPFLDRDTLEPICNADPHNPQDISMHHVSDAPIQALRYLIVTSGLLTMPASEASRVMISSYISYCNSLLGHIVASCRLESVQAILLFVIVLRNCDKIAWAWDILTMGVSMAQSIGINQTKSSQSSATGCEGPEYRTWWCMYVFEKFLALETSRPSTIWDRQLSETMASSVQVDSEGGPEHQFRNVLISLANMLHEMQERSARAWRREESLLQSVEQAIEDKLQTGGELILLLASWQDSLPAAYRPGSTPTLQFSNGPQFAFLSFYYNLGVILVNRSTLLVPKEELHTMVNKYAAGKPWQQSLLSGPAAVAEAARQMVKLFVSLEDSGTPNYLNTMASPLAAVYALAVHIFREHRSLLIRSDFELMKAAMQITKDHYHKHGMAENIDDILFDLVQYSSQCLETPPIPPDLASLGATRPALSELFMDDEPNAMSLSSPWGPSALDWAGWDLNDSSHLF